MNQALLDDQVRLAARFINDGHPRRNVYRALGISQATFYRRSKRLGLEVRRGRTAALLPLRLRLPTDPADLAYLAGIIDGEGCIAKGKDSGRWSVDIANNSQILMEWLREMGGSPYGAVDRPIFHWKALSHADVAGLLLAVLPYLKIKRSRAEQALREILPLLPVEGLPQPVDLHLDEALNKGRAALGGKE